MQNQLNTQMATGDTEDLYFGNGQNLIRFHQQLADHSPVTDEISSLPEELLVVLEGGKVPTIPTSLVPSFQYHRIDVLEEAGLSVPTTWEENLQVHADLRDHLEGQNMQNMVLATNPEVFSSMWYHQSDIKSNNANWFARDSDGVIQVALDDEPNTANMLEALRYYRDWGKSPAPAQLGAGRTSLNPTPTSRSRSSGTPRDCLIPSTSARQQISSIIRRSPCSRSKTGRTVSST
ncbi:extracellular solute-binding protein [Salinigranum rubrum]